MTKTFLRLACLAAVAAPGSLWAGTPNSGTLTPDTPMRTLNYTVGPFTASNPTPVPEVDIGPRCNARFECDSYKLTVTLPADSTSNRVRMTLAWPAGSNSDYDLYVYAGDQGNIGGGAAADVGESASGANPEALSFNAQPGTTTVFTIKVVPYTVTPAETPITGTIELLEGGGSSGGGGQSCVIPAGVRP